MYLFLGPGRNHSPVLNGTLFALENLNAKHVRKCFGSGVILASTKPAIISPIFREECHHQPGRFRLTTRLFQTDQPNSYADKIL